PGRCAALHGGGDAEMQRAAVPVLREEIQMRILREMDLSRGSCSARLITRTSEPAAGIGVRCLRPALFCRDGAPAGRDLPRDSSDLQRALQLTHAPSDRTMIQSAAEGAG